MSPRCLRGHLYESGYYSDPATGLRVCIACQEPMDLSKMSRHRRYYYRHRAQRIADSTARTRRRRERFRRLGLVQQ